MLKDLAVVGGVSRGKFIRLRLFQLRDQVLLLSCGALALQLVLGKEVRFLKHASGLVDVVFDLTQGVRLGWC